ARVPELIMIATRDDADIVGSLNVFPRRDPHGERLTVQDIVIGQCRFAKRNRQAGWIAAADPAPGGVHKIRFSVSSISADEHDGMRMEDRMRAEMDFCYGISFHWSLSHKWILWGGQSFLRG